MELALKLCRSPRVCPTSWRMRSLTPSWIYFCNFSSVSSIYYNLNCAIHSKSSFVFIFPLSGSPTPKKSVTRGVWRPTENSHFFLMRVVYFVRTVGLIFSSSSFQNPSYHGISERGGFWRFWFFGNFHLWVFHNNSHLWVLLTIGVILSSSLFQYPTYFVRSERGRILT